MKSETSWGGGRWTGSRVAIAVGLLLAVGLVAWLLFGRGGTPPVPPRGPSSPLPPSRAAEEALARDISRIETARKAIEEWSPDGAIEEPWIEAGRLLDAAAIYSNQTGMVDALYRDPEFLTAEAWLRGMTPADLMCIEVERGARRLAAAADIALELSRNLETIEAQRWLAQQLWSEQVLERSWRMDSRSFDAIRAAALAWGKPAELAIARANAETAKNRMTYLYETEIRSNLVRLGWPWDGGDQRLLPPFKEVRPQTGRPGTQIVEKARAQVAAITLRAIAENRIRVVGLIRPVLAKIDANAAEAYADSFTGLVDLPSSAWALLSKDEQTVVSERVREYIAEPAGLSDAQVKIGRAFESLQRSIPSQVIDEIDGDVRQLRLNDSSVSAGDPGVTVPKDGLKQSVFVGLGLAAGDALLTGVQVALWTAPEPLVTKVAAGVLLLAQVAWDAASARSGWYRMTSVRIAATESVASCFLGNPGHSAWSIGEKGDETTFLQAARPENGSILEAEMLIHREVRKHLEEGAHP